MVPLSRASLSASRCLPLLAGGVAILALTACDAGDAVHVAGTVSNQIESTVTSSADTLKAVAKAANARLGLGDSEQPPAKTKSKPVRHPRAKRQSGEHARPDTQQPEPTAAPTPPVAAPSPEEVQQQPEPLVAPPDVSAMPVGLDGNSSALALDAAPIYTRGDGDVTPPRLLRARVSTPILLGARADMNEMELVVSANGHVENVTVRTESEGPAAISPLVNSARTWEFEPARREGVAVRYRLSVSWDAAP